MRAGWPEQVDQLPLPFRRVIQRAEEAKKKKDQGVSATSSQFLPGLDVGAMPNHLNRSSLFAPVAKNGQREFHQQRVMVSRRDCVLEYTGEQMDEADADIVMALIFFAQRFPLGALVPLCRAALLKLIERSQGKNDYAWLHRRMKALTEATLFLEAKRSDGATRFSIGKTVSFRIISCFTYDDDAKTYGYILDPRWVQLFSNREYGLVDWEKRMQIRRGQDMAKTLQRLLVTSADQVQRYALDWLKGKMGYSGRVRDFMDALRRAVAELERVEIISKGVIEDEHQG